MGERLAGVNCRHVIYPYVPGVTEIPGDDMEAMEEKYGMSSEEYYRATQRQRSLERRIREKKREVAVGEDQGLDMTERRYELGDLQRRMRELLAETGLERDPVREHAYGVSHQPRGLNPLSRAAQARRELESLRRRNVSDEAAYELTSSPIAGVSSFDELDEMVNDRLGGGLSWGARDLDFESVRSVACGMDDVAQHFGIGEILPGQIMPWKLSQGTLAETSSSGSVRLSKKLFSVFQPTATSTGRHEAGHLIEVYLCHGDDRRFMSGKDAKRIITRAFRAYKADHPDTALDIHGAIFSISSYPAREASLTGNPGVEFSEGLAEAVERIVGQEVKKDSFLAYIDEAIRKDLS